MREGRVVIAAAVHDREVAGLPQPLEPDHAGIEGEVVVELEQPVRLEPDGRAVPVVGVVAVRDQRVQAVVAARHLEHDEDPVLELARRRDRMGDAPEHRARRNAAERAQRGRAGQAGPRQLAPGDAALAQEVPVHRRCRSWVGMRIRAQPSWSFAEIGAKSP